LTVQIFVDSFIPTTNLTIGQIRDEVISYPKRKFHRHANINPRMRVWLFLLCLFELPFVAAGPAPAGGPTPLLSAGHPVQWWFVFKLNGGKFMGCKPSDERTCSFGGEVQPYSNFSQRYVFASSDGTNNSDTSVLQEGQGCLGDTADDPLGATFGQIYNGNGFHYAVWNDQFYQDPEISGCSGDSCSAPWGHSKGIVSWDDSGQGTVIQVTTPSWPGSGSALHPRSQNDNTLGCVVDNNVKFSQHFFALSLTHDDLIVVLKALLNSSVVTDPANEQIVSNGGPDDVRALVASLGKKSASKTATIDELSTHVQIISKPSSLHVPPWQLVSSMLGKVPLRTATWWNTSDIPTTSAGTHIGCWNGGLAAPAAVQIATSGVWDNTPMSLKAGPSPDGNHAKIGVSTDSDSALAIFGDLNQEGAISGSSAACGKAQNARGGIFFVVKDAALSASVAKLIGGSTAGTQ
jgi:Deoxyribonuclease II